MSSKVSYAAVGIPYFFIRSLENALLPSMTAAFLSGPKVFMPAACRESTAPSTSGSSGATTAKSTPFFTAKSVMASISLAPMSTQVASFAIPPLPGSANISSTLSFSFIFFIMACSLPPPPTTITFISASRSLMMEKSYSRHGHHHAVFVAGIYDIVVSYRAARLSYVSNSALGRPLDVVSEGEEGV